MDIELEVEEKIEEKVVHQFAKLILGTAAGFIAGKLVQNAYDSILESRQNKTE